MTAARTAAELCLGSQGRCFPEEGTASMTAAFPRPSRRAAEMLKPRKMNSRSPHGAHKQEFGMSPPLTRPSAVGHAHAHTHAHAHAHAHAHMPATCAAGEPFDGDMADGVGGCKRRQPEKQGLKEPARSSPGAHIVT